LQFDLTGIPYSAEIVRAKLRMFCPFGSNTTNRLYTTAYPLDEAWVEFDLDPAELLANDYGFLLRGEGSENREVSYWFFSSEYVNAGVHPQLVVGYNLP